MEPKFEVSIIIQKPISEVFDAVYNPQKLSVYFVTGGASAPMKKGTSPQWDFADFPGAFPVNVTECIENKKIVFNWEAAEGGYHTTNEVDFESLNPAETKVRICETGWKNSERGIKDSYGNCMGWSQMLCAMKAYLEYGINLRHGAYKPIN